MSTAETGSGARLAIDIGGTFTDVVFGDPSGEIRALKVSTTPADITEGILLGSERIGADPRALEAFVHGTTIALNALLEGKTPAVGLITTRGFRDVLEIMRTNRPDMYNLQQEKPPPLVARKWRREIGARMTYTGEELAPVSSEEVRAIARDFAAAGISSVAVCLLHAYASPEHEQQVEEAIRAELPDAVVSLSSDISRVWREFERTSTTVSNAATKPIVSRYLSSLESKLGERGFDGQVLIMQSNGGVMSGGEARHRPVATLMSGPVGGVTGAIEIAKRLGPETSLITLDIGGTSADAAIIDRGEAVTRTVGQIGKWPVMVPMVDIESIGAGGGSIARVDEFGGLTVGPESAGANPGPACYGRGGTFATVTDANVVLGRIDPAYFLGGALQLDVGAAERAIEANVARAYGMSVEEAAHGIVTVINSNMTRLLWEVMIGRGYDPRDFSLLAFGGAGPLHACELAQALGIREVLVPREPGTFSALGILGAEIRHDSSRMLVGSGGSLTAVDLQAAYDELEGASRAQLEAEHAGFSHVDFIRSAELRYVGQEHWLSVDLPPGSETDADLLATTQGLFHEKHERLYGFRRTDVPVDLVRIQLSAIGRRAARPVAGWGDGSGTARRERSVRSIYVDGDRVQAYFYDRSALRVDERLEGPCVIEEPGCTTYVPPGFTASVDSDGIIHIDVPLSGREA